LPEVFNNPLSLMVISSPQRIACGPAPCI